MTKKKLRTEIKQRTLALDTTTRAAASAKILRRVEAMSQFTSARCVALFASLGDEPATTEALGRWGASKRLVVPKVEGNTMRFYNYNPSTAVRGTFGITEPGLGAPLCDPAQIDLIIVPGTAFTSDGKRMGRGKGYYDKYLAHRDFRGYKVGVCFRHQLLEELPVEAHDVAMDAVVAE